MKTRFITYLNVSIILLITICVALISISLFSITSLTLEQSISLITSGEIDVTFLSLLLISVMFVVAGSWCFKEWNTRRSFIYISESHLEVIPVDRREEYFELSM